MSYIRLIVPIALSYYNIVKISLRKEMINIFCEISGRNYGIKKPTLDEHWDEQVEVKA